MATINDELPTLLDHAKLIDPQGAVFNVVRMLSQQNAVLEDAVWKEGNLPTGHRFASDAALPSVSWRRFNEGIAPSKGRTNTVDETVGMLEGFSVCDVQLAKLNGNEAAFRAVKDRRFMDALANEADEAFIYHSVAATPEKIHGLAPRFNSTTGQGGKQIILHTSGASGADQTSIWFIVWGPETVYGIFPKGSNAGIEHKDMGEQLWDGGVATTAKYRAYVTNWCWKFGLCVQDHRYVARVANIDTSALSGTNDDLVPKMIEAWHQVKDFKSGRAAIYANRKVHTYLHLQARNATKNSTLSVDMVEGKPVVSFMGIPVRLDDSITNTESVIS